MNTYDFKHLYFPDPEPTPALDIADVLTTVGEHVYVGGTEIFWAHSYGDLGGEPEGLDATPLSSTVKLEKAGLQEQEQWTIDFYWNADDFSTLNTAKTAGTSVVLKVEMNDGSYFTNNGTVNAVYKTGGSVNAMAEGHAVCNLSGEWAYTAAS